MFGLEKDMSRREFITAFGSASIFWLTLAHAQPRLPRVGYLTPLPLSFDEDFRRGMRELGYVDGKNIRLVERFGGGSDNNLPKLAKELADMPVDVIVCTNSAATAAAMNSTKTIPVVMVTSADPIGSKFIASLARSGNNVTGLSSMAPETSTKQLELLKEAVPHAQRVAIIWNPLNPGNVIFLEKAWDAASALGMELKPVEVKYPQDLQPGLQSVARLDPHALHVLVDQVTIGHRAEVVKFANGIKCPAMYALREFVVDGGLMSFGVDFRDLWYRSASYVDKILRGAKPDDLPVQQPIKFQFVVNLVAAKGIGLTLPPSILSRADEVIE
jgi:putative tryptophan/tyrosine transport system substrate-binding protein